MIDKTSRRRITRAAQAFSRATESGAFGPNCILDIGAVAYLVLVVDKGGAYQGFQVLPTHQVHGTPSKVISTVHMKFRYCVLPGNTLHQVLLTTDLTGVLNIPETRLKDLPKNRGNAEYTVSCHNPGRCTLTARNTMTPERAGKKATALYTRFNTYVSDIAIEFVRVEYIKELMR